MGSPLHRITLPTEPSPLETLPQEPVLRWLPGKTPQQGPWGPAPSVLTVLANLRLFMTCHTSKAWACSSAWSCFLLLWSLVQSQLCSYTALGVLFLIPSACLCVCGRVLTGGGHFPSLDGQGSCIIYLCVSCLSLRVHLAHG